MDDLRSDAARTGVPRRELLTGAAAVGIVAMTLPSPVAAESVAGLGESESPTTTAPPAPGAPIVQATDAGTFTVTW